MSSLGDKPTDADGPFYRAAYRKAEQVDDAATPPKRRRAWAGLVATGVVALAEGFLRQTIITGAILLCLFTAFYGAMSGRLGWAIALIASGVIGIGYLIFALARRWSFGRLWSVILGVIGMQILLLIAEAASR